MLFLFTAIFGLIGAPLAFFGLLAVIATPSTTSFALFGFGLAFFSASLMIFRLGQAPERLIFDNERGWLCIEEKKGRKIQRAYLPYSDIDLLSMREHTTSSDGSKSTSYIVYFVKNDGAMWDLYSSNFSSKAEAFLEEFERRVDFSRETDFVDASPPEGVFEIVEGGERTLIRWKPPHEVFKTIVGLSFVGGFACMFVGFLWGEISTTVGVVVASIFGLLMLAMLYNLFSVLGAKKVIEVNRDTLRMYQEGGLFKKKSYELPLKDLQAICFDFDQSRHEGVIQLLRAEDIDLRERMKVGAISLDDIWQLAKLNSAERRIETGNLTIGEKLYLEQLLEDLIFEHAGHEVE
tara:strand:- start:5879 stop:6925 length:1047 start_codon:yes stop_codon:yes gene_type:complete